MKNILILYVLLGTWVAQAQSSVLSSGQWYKIGVTESGVYHLDKNTLDALGVPGDVDPRKMAIYGNSYAGMLPQANDESRPFDLLKNNVKVLGETDGRFDAEDRLLFYAVGPDRAVWSEAGLSYEKNLYSDTAYYFLRIDDEHADRIQPAIAPEGEPSAMITTYEDHLLFEEDKVNLISSGRYWYGSILSSGDTQSASYVLEGLVSPVDMTINCVSQSSEGGIFTIRANGTVLGDIELAPVPDGLDNLYSIKAREAARSWVFNPASNEIDLAVSFDGGVAGERGFVDFYYLTFSRRLQKYGAQSHFRVPSSLGELLQYEVENASGITIWNVSNPTQPTEVSYQAQNGKAVFLSLASAMEEFVVFDPASTSVPFVFGAVANQNLKGATSYDGVIITAPEFWTEAQRLAQFHASHDGLSVDVVTPRQIYNEFSSGRQDVVAIRDYLRYLYDRGSTLKYALLFGDCSYDYKDRLPNNTNFVPTYESRNSFHPIFSYSSDDFYAFLESNEGDWVENSFGDHTMEIGIGRLPAKDLEEAVALVDKITYYSTSANTLGGWRNRMTYVADDGDGNIHARHVEDLSQLIDTTYAQYQIEKLLLDAYPQEASGSSEESPQAVAALKTALKKGTFIVNFIGHGNPSQWMAEKVLTNLKIGDLTNRNRLPIFVTATCEFGQNDNPFTVSGAEQLLLLSQGGAIALLTTSRPVFASTNFSLNQAFHESIFMKKDGQGLRLGDIIRMTKNDGLEGPINRNFILLGDPMMMPAFPQLGIHINELTSDLDTLSALERVTFTGEVRRGDARETRFNGRLMANVLDVPQSFTTLGQESDPYTYLLRNNALFRGEATVIDGEFTVTFVVPKGISYQFEKGNLSLYAWDDKNNLDAEGAYRSIVIGGTEEEVENDTTPPEITMVLNDDSFKDGDLVGDSPLLIAHLSDANGITTTRSGVIEGISLRIADEVVNLNDFYTSSIDDFTEGTVVFPIQNLAPGSYTATLKVWDTYNNASEASIRFRVTADPVLFIYNPSFYPNPLQEAATLTFEHDREDEDLNVTIILYKSDGSIVSDRRYTIENSSRTVGLEWNPITNTGQLLPQGIYYARVIIRSKLDGATKEISQKLVITN